MRKSDNLYDEEIQYAKVLERIGAFAIDVIFISLFSIFFYLLLFIDVIGPLFLLIVPGLYEYAHYLAGFLWFIFIWLYFAGSESSRFQGTLGKYLLGLKVTDDYGEQVSFKETSLRFICKWVSFSVLLVGIFMALFMERKQTFHDFVVKTVVVKA